MRKDLSGPCIANRTLAAPEHILVAVDSSDSDYLVSHAMAQAQRCGAHVTLLHAIVPLNSMAVEAGAIPCINDTAFEVNAQRMLRELAMPLNRQNIDCDVITRHGFAAEVIRDQIERGGASRLIMGTHGRKHLAQFALGSVAQEVLQSSRIPVFAVGPHAHRRSGRETPRKILHPVSLADHCEESLRFALDVARVYGADLHLLHVLPTDLESNADPGRSLDWAENAMVALLPQEDDRPQEVKTSATFGNVIREILFAAAVADADWILVGVRGKGPRWPLSNNTAYRVMAEANCPVLTIPHPC